MIWDFKGKHQGKNINDVPTDYLEWILENSKNTDARSTAKKALDYRASRGESGGSSYQGKSSDEQMIKNIFDPEKIDMFIRGIILTTCVFRDPVNPWEFFQEHMRYVVFNEAPKPKKVTEEKPHLSDENFDPFEKDDDSEAP